MHYCILVLTPVIVMKSRVKVPRRAFIRFMREGIRD